MEGRYHALIALCVTTSARRCAVVKREAEENRGNPTPHSYDHRFQAFVGSDVEVHPERRNEGECHRIRLIVADSGEPIAAPSEFPAILWVGSNFILIVRASHPRDRTSSCASL